MSVCTWLALMPLRKPRALALLSWIVGMVITEMPFIAIVFLTASTVLAFAEGDISSPAAWMAVGLAALAVAGLIVIFGQGVMARPVLQEALRHNLEPGGQGINSKRPARILGLLHCLFAPFLLGRLDVQRVANISYGDAGRRNLLDIYRHRRRRATGPVLLYFHGGGYFSGGKSREARTLLYRLAAHGWLCISANYRLRPKAQFPDHLIDVKKAIAWYRTDGHEFGGDPAQIFLAGSSAGAQLAALAALTPNEPAFQHGFESVDTGVAAAICLYGYYGPYYGHDDTTSGPASSAHAYINQGAPPLFLAHGVNDTYVPVEGARRFAHELASESTNPVVYAELPGAQHSFDRFHSLRFVAVVDAIEAFTDWVRSHSPRSCSNQ
jgi:acetyl esterase/lipase